MVLYQGVQEGIHFYLLGLSKLNTVSRQTNSSTFFAYDTFTGKPLQCRRGVVAQLQATAQFYSGHARPSEEPTMIVLEYSGCFRGQSLPASRRPEEAMFSLNYVYYALLLNERLYRWPDFAIREVTLGQEHR